MVISIRLRCLGPPVRRILALSLEGGTLSPQGWPARSTLTSIEWVWFVRHCGRAEMLRLLRLGTRLPPVALFG